MTQSVHPSQHKPVMQTACTKLSVNQPPTCHSEEKASETGSDSALSDSALSDSALSDNTFSDNVFLDNAFSERERFELLSAYIDGEVSTHERQIVERWLASDVHMQQTYQAQLKLSRAMQFMLQDY